MCRSRVLRWMSSRSRSDDAVPGRGQRPVAAPPEQPHDLVVQAVGPQAGDPDLPPAVHDEAQDLGQARVVRHRRADEPDPARLGRDQRLHPVGLDQPHAAVRRSAHDAVGAPAMTAALGLDQEHVRQLGVRRQDLGEGRQQRVVGRRDGRRALAVDGRDVEPGPARQVREQGPARRRRANRVAQLDDRLFGLAQQDDVGVGRGGNRVRKREWPADDDQREPLGAGQPLFGQQRDPGHVQAIDEPGQLQLVRQRERDDREVAHGAPALVGAQRVGAGPRRPAVVRQKGPLGGDALQPVQPAVDRLKPERRHPDRVRARVTERERQLGLLEDGPALVRQAGVADVTEGNHREPDIIRPRRPPCSRGHLDPVEPRVEPAGREQRVVRALLDDPAVVQHHDAVGPPHGREAVGDHDRRSPPHQLGDAALDHPFRLGIDAGGRLVQDQDLGLARQGPRERHQLPLAARKVRAPLDDGRVQPLGPRRDDAVGARPAGPPPGCGRRSAPRSPSAMFSRSVPANMKTSWLTTTIRAAQAARVQRRGRRPRRCGWRRAARRKGAAAA